MKTLLVLTSFVVVLTAGGHAGAALSDAEETKLLDTANSYMKDSRWSDALPVYAKLYAETSNASYLWNVAYCHHQRALASEETPEEAIIVWREYLMIRGLPEPNRAQAKGYLRQLAELAKRRAAEGQASSEATGASRATSPPPEQRKPMPDPRDSGLAEMQDDEAGGSVDSDALAPWSPSTPTPGEAVVASRRRGRVATPVVWTVAAGGLASIVAGLYFSIRTSELESQITNAPQFQASDYSAGKTAHVLQFVGYGLGAAALGVAGLLYYKSSDSAATPRSGVRISIAPPVSTPGAVALFDGRF